ILGLVIYSATFSIFGGLKAVVWTDVIQAIVLVIGGLFAAYFVISAVGDGTGFFGGLSAMFEKAPEKFDMILSKDNPSYDILPGIAVLVGGLWIANLYYWGLNQYIIQRALAAKNIHEAQKGVAFAGFLKLLMPLIAVLPGIAVFVLGGDIDKPDEAFPWVLKNYVPIGLKGLTFAALIAAIGSSVSSMVNSTSTIFTLDIYKTLINKEASESNLVLVGRITAGAALIIGALVAPALSSLDQAFQFIQEFTGFIAPGILVVFVFGLFWKRASANAAMSVVILSIPLSFALKYFFPELPFLDRMGLCFLLLSSLMLGVSLLENNKSGNSRDIPYKWLVFGSILLISIPSGFKILIEDTEVSNWFGYIILGLSAIVAYVLFSEKRADDPKAISIEKGLFKTDSFFNISAIVITLVLAVIYTLLW
ncbi:MAG: sodium/solute symporter, partial [Bacteroidota bacterium]